MSGGAVIGLLVRSPTGRACSRGAREEALTQQDAEQHQASPIVQLAGDLAAGELGGVGHETNLRSDPAGHPDALSVESQVNRAVVCRHGAGHGLARTNRGVQVQAVQSFQVEKVAAELWLTVVQ